MSNKTLEYTQNNQIDALTLAHNCSLLGALTHVNNRPDLYFLMVWDIDKKTKTVIPLPRVFKRVIGNQAYPQIGVYNNNSLMLYEKVNNKWVNSYSFDHFFNKHQSQFAFTHDGNKLITAQHERITDEVNVPYRRYIYGIPLNAENDTLVISRETLDRPSLIQDIACSYDNNYFALGTSNNTIDLYDVASCIKVSSCRVTLKDDIENFFFDPQDNKNIVIQTHNKRTEEFAFNFFRWSDNLDRLTQTIPPFETDALIWTFQKSDPCIFLPKNTSFNFNVKNQMLVQKVAQTSASLRITHFFNDQQLEKLSEENLLFIAYLDAIKRSYQERHEKRSRNEPHYRYAFPLGIDFSFVAKVQHRNNFLKRLQLYGYLTDRFKKLPEDIQLALKERFRLTSR